MKSLEYINLALDGLQKDVEILLSDESLSMQQKDAKMFIVLKQKEILVRVKSELEDIKNNPPKPKPTCKGS